MATDTLDVISGARFGKCGNPVCQVIAVAEDDDIVGSTILGAEQDIPLSPGPRIIETITDTVGPLRGTLG
ncbi:hypothetical protein PV10_09175 [Exophiala mesophila]|uniref:Uncharacterized protein n=1 Tax=Exophiala mesophila TaxID=212818 RepID=A0A0D1XIK7_EXOME|nr:uncharacterized protein PV10_09175 [Exophiala mesophila]KIV87996.1 hypothetical protein PV10_09175 [Exophiala mesophila]